MKSMESAFAIIAEPNRRAILSLLVTAEQTAGEIERHLGMAQPAVSKHLRVLREAGLLEVEKEGRLRRYALPEGIKREAAAGRVLDLGCCSFQFDENGAASRPNGKAPSARKSSRPRRK